MPTLYETFQMTAPDVNTTGNSVAVHTCCEMVCFKLQLVAGQRALRECGCRTCNIDLYKSCQQDCHSKREMQLAVRSATELPAGSRRDRNDGYLLSTLVKYF
jgi:hypothetical protein